MANPSSSRMIGRTTMSISGIEPGTHLTNDGQLLKIFSTKKCLIGLYQCKKTAYHLGYTIEVSRAKPAFHDLLQSTKIEFAVVFSPDKFRLLLGQKSIGAGVGQQLSITLKCTGIISGVLYIVGNHWMTVLTVTTSVCVLTYQRKVSPNKGSHGRHKTNGLVLLFIINWSVP